METDWVLEPFQRRQHYPIELSPYRLREGANVIGRSLDAHLQLPFNSVARKHCRVTVARGLVLLEDLRSRNHTYLNGEQVEYGYGKILILEPDDVIGVTEVNLRLGRVTLFDPAWLRALPCAVLGLALQIAEGDIELLPVLGDALEDAGCTDPEVLRTCRRKAPRQCGSWVVDNLLGLELPG